MSLKTSIGWTDLTCNPIKGKCKGGCWYCYYSGKRGIANRFKLDSEIRLDLDVFFKLPKSPKKIFLCSTHDLFGDWIPSWWRYAIFERIESYSQHTFQILTKFPQNIDRPMPDNVYLGVTITKNEDIWRRNRLVTTDAKIKFISFEPLLEDLDFTLYQKINWVIIGCLTGYGHKYDPKLKWIKKIVRNCADCGIRIFLKDNLSHIWGNNLIQQIPMED